MGLYISFSRGALFACAAGAVALLVAAPRRQQLWSLIIAVCAGGAGALVAAPLHAVTSLSGAAATREREGAIAFGLLALVMVVAMQLQLRLADRQTTGALRLPRRSPLIATGLICAGLALAIVVGGKEGNGVSSSGANRYASLQSNRYAYWRVALRAFGDQPLRGVGAGGWAVYWLRYRPFDDFAVDAHSLPLQTAAELGLVGLALLLAFLGGVAAAARSAHRTSGELAAGPLAGCVVWVAHAPLDWDWQLPAVTLVALVLAGALLVLAEPDAPATAPA
jgi:O-antigen ligase